MQTDRFASGFIPLFFREGFCMNEIDNKVGMEKGSASAHPTNGVAEDEGKSGGLWPAVDAPLLAASLVG